MDSDAVAKPDELLALGPVTEEMFGVLQRWFDVPDTVSLNLSGIDAAVTELGDPQMIAAMAMRKLQALHLLSRPGVRTTTDVVVTIVQDLDRALIQAPTMRIRFAGSSTDWDAALRDLNELEDFDADADQRAEEAAETERFQELHAALHEAVMAVLRATDNEIKPLE
jgi:hypothetical protein